MLKQSEAGFRRLLPLLRPHLRQLSLGLVCMLVYVGTCVRMSKQYVRAYVGTYDFTVRI